MNDKLYVTMNVKVLLKLVQYFLHYGLSCKIEITLLSFCTKNKKYNCLILLENPENEIINSDEPL